MLKENEIETILILRPIDLKAQIVNNIEDLIPTPTKVEEVFVPVEEVIKKDEMKNKIKNVFLLAMLVFLFVGNAFANPKLNEVSIAFLHVVGGPYGDTAMSMGSARKAAKIAMQKLNTLTNEKGKPVLKFIGGKVIKIRQRYVGRIKASDVYRRGAAYMRYVEKASNIRANYVHVWDTDLDWKNLEPNAVDENGNPTISLAHGWAYLCQNRRKKYASYSITSAKEDGHVLTVFNGIMAAHEIGHLLGFDHVTVFWDGVSIMDENIALYRYVTDPDIFYFYDQLDSLPFFQCSINLPDMPKKR